MEQQIASTHDFLHTTLGSTGLKVHRVGLSATYRPGRKTVYRAIDEGINYLFCFGIDTHMIRVMREIPAAHRQDFVFATGAYNLIIGHPDIRRTLEKRLRQLRTDYIDIFMFLGVTKGREFPPRLREEFYRLREEGKIRAVGMSTHDRVFAGKMAMEGALDVFMIRYNAAHRGAETDIFPHLEKHRPGIVSFTATCWRRLHTRLRRWPKEEPVPTPGMSYRFVLSNPHVHVCMMAPTGVRQLEANLAEVKKGPLDTAEIDFIRRYGDAIYRR